MKKILLCSLLLSLPALADPPPRMRIKEDRLRKIAADKQRVENNPWEFTAPDGFTVTATDPKAPAAKADFAATSLTPAATMNVVVEKGAVTIDQALLDDQPKKLTEKFVAEHAGGSAKLVKKELVKLDDGSAIRVVLETRADAKKSTKPMREVHYIIGNTTHHAHLVYATAAAGFAKLEKKFDESLRKTKPYSPEP
jgi:hypothetical protein